MVLEGYVEQASLGSENLDSQPGAAAPAHWKTELFAQYPWIEQICPDPTSLTGGIGGVPPWRVAENLQPGSVATGHC